MEIDNQPIPEIKQKFDRFLLDPFHRYKTLLKHARKLSKTNNMDKNSKRYKKMMEIIDENEQKINKEEKRG
jgi:hypothetical protein